MRHLTTVHHASFLAALRRSEAVVIVISSGILLPRSKVDLWSDG